MRDEILKSLKGFILLASLFLQAGAARGQETTVWAGTGFGPLRRFPGRWFGSLEVNHAFGDFPIQGWVSADVFDKGRLLSLGPMVQVQLGPRWAVAASSGPGWVSTNVNDLLGCRLEFRSSAYVFRRVKDGWKAGLTVSHYSNGGVSRHNPGAEDVRMLIGYEF